MAVVDAGDQDGATTPAEESRTRAAVEQLVQRPRWWLPITIRSALYSSAVFEERFGRVADGGNELDVEIGYIEQREDALEASFPR
jgi:hypothetical protein